MSTNTKNIVKKYFVELTDTFGGDANYGWVNRYKVTSVSERGAISKVARESGYAFRFDGIRYNAQGAAVCAFIDEWDDACHSLYNTVTL